MFWGGVCLHRNGNALELMNSLCAHVLLDRWHFVGTVDASPRRVGWNRCAERRPAVRWMLMAPPLIDGSDPGGALLNFWC